MAIKHSKVILRPDGADPAEAQPSDWNADHEVDGLVGLLLSLAEIPDAFPYIRTDGTPGMALLSAPARAMLAAATNDLILAAIGAASAISPALTGSPTAPTAAPGDNSTLIANTAFVHAAVAAIVASAPALLDTLKELADAIADDPNFSTTMATALGNRLRFDVAQVLTSPQKTQLLANAGLAAVAASGAYADLSGKPALAAVATSGAYADLSGKPSLGTAAPLNVGTGANNVVQLDAGSKLPAVDGSALINIPVSGFAFSQCVLKLTGGNLVLSPLNGNRLTVNGANCSIPDAGVSLAATGLTAATVYYIYAVATAGVITSLEASTTGHSPSTTVGNKGVEIKTGADTRTLVGMAYVTAGPVWSLCRSWFHDPGFKVSGSFTATRSTTSLSPVEINTEIRCTFLSWANELIQAASAGAISNGVAGANSIGGIGYDGAVDGGSWVVESDNTGSFSGFNSKSQINTLSEGVHFASIYGFTSTGGTAAWTLVSSITNQLSVYAPAR